jgi:Dynein heavy chain, N-terminal region 2
VVQDLVFRPFDFNTLLKANIDAHLPAVAAVSLKASKEASLEKALAKMRGEWAGVAFIVVAYKETGTHVLGGVDDVQARLHEHTYRVVVRCAPAHSLLCASTVCEPVMLGRDVWQFHVVGGSV